MTKIDVFQLFYAKECLDKSAFAKLPLDPMLPKNETQNKNHKMMKKMTAKINVSLFYIFS